ncbi:MAG: phosphatase PAP2 family protein [Anaerolineae bacterium]
MARFAADRPRGRLWAALLALLIMLVALSRVYLGVHFPGDVLWGASVGLGLLALHAALRPVLLPRLKQLSFSMHLLLALATAAIMLIVVALLLAIPFGVGPTFGNLYVEARSNALEDAATVAGLAFGLWIGLVMESRYVRFSVAGPWPQRGVRYLAGIVGLFVIWMGLRVLFPQEPLVPALVLRMVRYGLAMLWAIALWPWLFVRVGLGARI